MTETERQETHMAERELTKRLAAYMVGVPPSEVGTILDGQARRAAEFLLGEMANEACNEGSVMLASGFIEQFAAAHGLTVPAESEGP